MDRFANDYPTIRDLLFCRRFGIIAPWYVDMLVPFILKRGLSRRLPLGLIPRRNNGFELICL